MGLGVYGFMGLWVLSLGFRGLGCTPNQVWICQLANSNDVLRIATERQRGGFRVSGLQSFRPSVLFRV